MEKMFDLSNLEVSMQPSDTPHPCPACGELECDCTAGEIYDAVAEAMRQAAMIYNGE